MQHASKVLAVAVGFLLGSVSAVSAGVVMSETAVASGLNGNEMVHRTIYVQGNKQKVDTDGLQTITDLDKRLVYVVDKTHKDYVELPLASMSDALADGVPGGAAIVLKRTGSTQRVAAHSCDEYRGRTANDQLQITVSACVSMSAPGASEIARFDRRMISRIQGLKSATSSEESAGVVLQKKSVVNLRVPDPEQQGHRTASMMTKTTVNSIRVKPLAAQTFTPPKGYTKVENQPPAELPDGIESAMLSQPFYRDRSSPAAVDGLRIPTVSNSFLVG
ncbi:MAG TPA: hypothetical protein VGY99_06685 [Candidatus Binataceae bacterium]|jgi:hypothetical protein|nr:hypothetical protein [Candidatus Binataceae bacterium]